MDTVRTHPLQTLGVALLLPVFLPVSIALCFLEPAFRSGGTIEVYAFKE